MLSDKQLFYLNKQHKSYNYIDPNHLTICIINHVISNQTFLCNSNCFKHWLVQCNLICHPNHNCMYLPYPNMHIYQLCSYLDKWYCLLS